MTNRAEGTARAKALGRTQLGMLEKYMRPMWLTWRSEGRRVWDGLGGPRGLMGGRI